MAEAQTLYERLGGYNAIAACSADLTDRLYVNSTLNANPAIGAFHEKHEKDGFKFMLTGWCCEFTGGPKGYVGRTMTDAHAHLNVTKREFDIVVNEIRTTLYKFNVPEPELEEFITLIESYRGQIVRA